MDAAATNQAAIDTKATAGRSAPAEANMTAPAQEAMYAASSI